MAVHDRISLDAYRIIKKLGDHLVAFDEEPEDAIAETINRVNGIITDLQAFSGLASESMTRTHGWRFLQLGRGIERAYQTAELLSATMIHPIANEYPVLESILQTTDSIMTYRSRYLLQMQPMAVIDLLVNDETNPRSIGYQLALVNQFLGELPSEKRLVGLGPDERMASELLHRIRTDDLDQLSRVSTTGQRAALNELLTTLIEHLPKLSDAITARYLIHTDATVALTGRVDPLVPKLPAAP